MIGRPISNTHRLKEAAAFGAAYRPYPYKKMVVPDDRLSKIYTNTRVSQEGPAGDQGFGPAVAPIGPLPPPVAPVGMAHAVAGPVAPVAALGVPPAPKYMYKYQFKSIAAKDTPLAPSVKVPATKIPEAPTGSMYDPTGKPTGFDPSLWESEDLPDYIKSKKVPAVASPLDLQVNLQIPKKKGKISEIKETITGRPEVPVSTLTDPFDDPMNIPFGEPFGESFGEEKAEPMEGELLSEPSGEPEGVEESTISPPLLEDPISELKERKKKGPTKEEVKDWISGSDILRKLLSDKSIRTAIKSSVNKAQSNLKGRGAKTDYLRSLDSMLSITNREEFSKKGSNLRTPFSEFINKVKSENVGLTASEIDDIEQLYNAFLKAYQGSLVARGPYKTKT